ncbi:hypothetical protein ACKWTF_012617 [Chironomus riparius]
MMKILLLALTVLQITMRITCIPAYVISSYSNVRLQQPTSAVLSVESQMPIEIMLNPKLADEQPTLVDKMESIFMKSDQKTIKNLKTMNMDESEMMETINKQNLSQTQNDDENVFDESDLVAVGNMEPAGFSMAVAEN